MALLVSTMDQTAFDLPSYCLVGRSPDCPLYVSDGRVSWEHARIQWSGRSWELRDLGSRNGTFIDGQRVPAGRSVELRVGMVLSFGQAHQGWTVSEVSEPQIGARCVETGAWRRGADDLLVIPSDEEPLVCLFQGLDGTWVAETGDGSQPVQDRSRIEAGGLTWELRLPEPITPTWQTTGEKVALPDLVLRFGVSRDEEQVVVEVACGADVVARAENVYNYLLLALARQRVEDAELPDLDERDRGWVYRDELCRMLALDQAQLNMHVFRARKMLSRCGVSGAAHLIERRTLTQQLRLGTGNVELHPV